MLKFPPTAIGYTRITAATAVSYHPNALLIPPNAVGEPPNEAPSKIKGWTLTDDPVLRLRCAAVRCLATKHLPRAASSPPFPGQRVQVMKAVGPSHDIVRTRRL